MIAEGPRAGLNPECWGHHFWETMHYITLGYPEHSPSAETRQAARDFMLTLRYLLPCSLCRQHIIESFDTSMPLTPDVFDSRVAFGTYIVRLRDLVKRNHVLPPGTSWPTHDFSRDVVDRLRTRPRSPHHWWTVAAWCIVLAVGLGVLSLVGSSPRPSAG
jgi:hypothetical protein